MDSIKVQSGVFDPLCLCESRMFSYLFEGKERWVGIPACATLRHPGTKDKLPYTVRDMEDGDIADGEVIIDNECYTVTFACIEP